MTTVGIVGFGHVGKSLKQLFPDAAVYDPYLPDHNASRDRVNEADICFIAVPTPSGPDGTADTSAVDDVTAWLRSEIIVVRSTVPPGTTNRLRDSTGKRIVFSPEYHGESRYRHPWTDDPASWPFVIAGGLPQDTRPVIALFAATLGPEKTYRQVDAQTAELAKYMENTWLASQVAFAWQFALISDTLGIDYWEARELWALDPRVSRWHTAVFDDAPGFGGKCLPKDVRAITEAARAAGCNVQWLDALQHFNKTLREYPESGLLTESSDRLAPTRP